MIPFQAKPPPTITVTLCNTPRHSRTRSIRVRPVKFGWFPNGAAAVLLADITNLPRGAEEIRGDTAAVCMAFADLVVTGELIHSGDPMLTAQVEGAQKIGSVNTWAFTRVNGYVDAVYAAAGAAHLARTVVAKRQPAGFHTVAG